MTDTATGSIPTTPLPPAPRPAIPTDPLGRPLISDAIRAQVVEAFKAVPEGQTVALLVISDASGTRGMLAGKIGEHWQVAAGGGVTWDAKPSGYVAIHATWP